MALFNYPPRSIPLNDIRVRYWPVPVSGGSIAPAADGSPSGVSTAGLLPVSGGSMADGSSVLSVLSNI